MTSPRPGAAKTFAPKGSDITGLRWILGFLGVLLLAFIALHFLPGATADERAEGLRIAAVAVPGMLAMWYAFRRMQRNHRTLGIAIDDVGIWQSHLPRQSGLIPWNRVARVVDGGDRVQLVDAQGTPLLLVRDGIHDFERLRRVIVERVGHPAPPTLPFASHESRLSHVVIWTLAVLAAVGALFIEEWTWRVISVSVLAFLVWYGLSRAHGLIVTARGLEMRYATGIRTYDVADILSVQLVDQPRNDDGEPQPAAVEVAIRGRSRPLLLGGADSLPVYHALRAAMEAHGAIGDRRQG